MSSINYRYLISENDITYLKIKKSIFMLKKAKMLRIIWISDKK